MKATLNAPSRAPGRPRSFDRDQALTAALQLFWRYGYEATSLSELTKAMGITPPSLYNAFGDKKQLFLAVVEKYIAGPMTVEEAIAAAPSARAAAQSMLEGSVRAFTARNSPKGCLLASAVISCAAESADLQAYVTAIRTRIERALNKKIEGDIQTGQLPRSLDAGACAAHVIAVIQGISTLARDGAPREKLMRVAAMALTAWPSA